MTEGQYRILTCIWYQMMIDAKIDIQYLGRKSEEANVSMGQYLYLVIYPSYLNMIRNEQISALTECETRLVIEFFSAQIDLFTSQVVI